jgi:hypothetical protein
MYQEVRDHKNNHEKGFIKEEIALEDFFGSQVPAKVLSGYRKKPRVVLTVIS